MSELLVALVLLFPFLALAVFLAITYWLRRTYLAGYAVGRRDGLQQAEDEINEILLQQQLHHREASFNPAVNDAVFQTPKQLPLNLKVVYPDDSE